MAYKSGNILTLSGGIYVIDTNDYVLGDIKANVPLSGVAGPLNKPHKDLQDNIEYVKNYAETLSGNLESNFLHRTGNISETINGDKTFNSSVNITNGFNLSGSMITATAAELNILDGVTATFTQINAVANNSGEDIGSTYHKHDSLYIEQTTNVSNANLEILTGNGETILHSHASDALVASATLSADASTITLSGLDISSHNNTYRVIIAAKKDATGGSPATVRIYFNNDTTNSNYSYSYISTNGTVVGTGTALDAKLADIPHNLSYSANLVLTLLFSIVGYTGTQNVHGYAAGTIHGHLVSGSSSYLTRIDLVIDSGNFVTGSSIKVFKD